MVTTYTEHIRSTNLEATFRGNISSIVYFNLKGLYIPVLVLITELWKHLFEEITKLQFTAVVLITINMVNTRTKNIEAHLKGYILTIVYSSPEHSRSRNIEVTWL